jgi:hypothetical protein
MAQRRMQRRCIGDGGQIDPAGLRAFLRQAVGRLDGQGGLADTGGAGDREQGGAVKLLNDQFDLAIAPDQIEGRGQGA